MRKNASALASNSGDLMKIQADAKPSRSAPHCFTPPYACLPVRLSTFQSLATRPARRKRGAAQRLSSALQRPGVSLWPNHSRNCSLICWQSSRARAYVYVLTQGICFRQRGRCSHNYAACSLNSPCGLCPLCLSSNEPMLLRSSSRIGSSFSPLPTFAKP